MIDAQLLAKVYLRLIEAEPATLPLSVIIKGTPAHTLYERGPRPILLDPFEWFEHDAFILRLGDLGPNPYPGFDKPSAPAIWLAYMERSYEPQSSHVGGV